MRIWSWIGMFLALFVLVLGFVHLADAYLFALLAVAVLLIGVGSVTGQ